MLSHFGWDRDAAARGNSDYFVQCFAHDILKKHTIIRLFPQPNGLKTARRGVQPRAVRRTPAGSDA